LLYYPMNYDSIELSSNSTTPTIRDVKTLMIDKFII
jgi:hypothetical protein